MVLRFFFFENTRLNFVVYFTITTVVLILGPERFIPGLKTRRESPVIEAPCGSLKGKLLTSRKGRTIDSYQGIPYAKPPTGSRRFGRPEAFEDPAWEGVLDASSNGQSCFQSSSVMPLIGEHGQEDCLTLNVYRPAGTDKNSHLPVMVWFHGGGFVVGSSETIIYGPGYLLDRDVILVTANYRLGVLGFFSLGPEGEDHDVQGNQGLWDQVEVLKWVRKNIRAFGGNPKRVTIFGESAGGMSVSYHLVSKASRGLFQAAIVQSGPLYAPFVKTDYNRPLHELHKEISESLGCPVSGDNVEAAVKCLRSKTPSELNDKMFLFDQCNVHDPHTMPFPAVWSHTDDSKFSSKPFFSSDPYAVMKSDAVAKVPTMIGFNREDGLLQTASLIKNPDVFDFLKKNWNFCGPTNMLGHFYDRIDETSQSLSHLIKNFYLETEDFDIGKDFSNLTKMFTDAAFGIGTDMMVRDLAALGRDSVFYYVFEHRGSDTLTDVFKSTKLQLLLITIAKFFGLYTPEKLGACHADDILYLFKPDIPISFSKPEEDEKMIDLIVDMWTNFATFHDPTPSFNLKSYQDTEVLSGDRVKLAKWPKVGSESISFARLNRGLVVTDPDDEMESRLRFWRDHIVSHLFK